MEGFQHLVREHPRPGASCVFRQNGEHPERQPASELDRMGMS